MLVMCGARSSPPRGDAGASATCSAEPLHAIHLVGFDPTVQGDLERGIQPGAGEGEHFYQMPVSGRVVRVELVAWVTETTQAVVFDLARTCHGPCPCTQSVTAAASMFPVRGRDGRRATSITLATPLVVEAGDALDVVVHPVGGTLVLEILTEGTDGAGEMIFPDGMGPAAPTRWDAILRAHVI
jgi:hypothetical protein